MKFVFGYKTSDGVRHEDILNASSRDAVYAALKRRGIRPYSVELAPGFVNWLAVLVRRRMFLFAMGGVVAATLFLSFFRGGKEVWQPSPDYIRLEKEAERVLAERETNPEARESLKRLFRDLYPKLSTEFEKDRAQALYGRIAMQLEEKEDAEDL